ncbi:hypothetical protein GQ37_008260 [Janthinobacterium sp. BJB1]|nr:hypothetical protein GQ37_008260 [Janthinobacterium sp. BJB1]
MKNPSRAKRFEQLGIVSFGRHYASRQHDIAQLLLKHIKKTCTYQRGLFHAGNALGKKPLSASRFRLW